MAVNELDDNDIAHLRRTAQKDFEEVDDKETLRIAYKFYMNKVRQRVEETTLASLVGPRAGAGASRCRWFEPNPLAPALPAFPAFPALPVPASPV